MNTNIEEFENFDFEEIPNVIKLSGVSWGERQQVIAKLKPNTPLKMIRDYNNPYDKNAIFISLVDGTQVGWIPKRQAEILAPQLDAGFSWNVTVKEVIGSHETNYGLLINLIHL